MAHLAQRTFCSEVKERFASFFAGTRVLEIGSRNVNGSVRELFDDCDYVGVDCQDGPDVDVVCFGHEYEGEPDSFDVVCSLETFEHDPYADQTLGHMLRMLRPGGLLFATCADERRPEHGTQRTGKKYGPDGNFYRGVSLELLGQWLLEADVRFAELLLRDDPLVHDLYIYAVKADDDASVGRDAERGQP